MIRQIDREVKRLSKMDFTGWNEITVREEFIKPLLDVLGYYKGSEYDINREGQHLLNKQFLMIGRDKINIDYELLVRKKNFWIIEAKSAKPHKINEKSICQAHMYAIHPEVNAHYYAVINGWEIKVYDARKWKEDYKPILKFESKDLPNNFKDLNDILGAKNILKILKKNILRDIKDVLSTEILEERLEEFQKDVKLILSNTRGKVKENRREAMRIKSSEFVEMFENIIETGTLEQIIKTAFELADTNQLFNITYSVFNSRFEKLDENKKTELIDKIVQIYRGRLSTTHRLNLIKLLIKILPKNNQLSGSYFYSIANEIQGAIKVCLSQFEKYNLWKELWEMEGNLYRVNYKSSFILKKVGKVFKRMVNVKENILTDEDLAFNKPHIASERLEFVERVVDAQYRYFSHLDIGELIKLNKELNDFDERIDTDFKEKFSKIGDDEKDFLYYYAYNKPFDFLNSKLFHMLCDYFNDISHLIDDEIVELTKNLLNLRSKDYAVNFADSFLIKYLYQKKQYDISFQHKDDELNQINILFNKNYARLSDKKFKITGSVNYNYISVEGFLDIKNNKLEISKINR